MARKDSFIKCSIESSLEDSFKSLCEKRSRTVSAAIRELIIDELRMQGMLPDEYAVQLLKG